MCIKVIKSHISEVFGMGKGIKYEIFQNIKGNFELNQKTPSTSWLQNIISKNQQ